jgi:hypothetical protein
VGSKVGIVFGSSFSWIPRKLGNPLSCDMYIFHDTCNIEACLAFTPYLAPDLYNHLKEGDTLSCCQKLYFYFLVAEVQNFSLSFLATHMHVSLCYGTTWLHCQSSMCLLCSCCTRWVLRLRSPWEPFFVDLACGSVAPPIW